MAIKRLKELPHNAKEFVYDDELSGILQKLKDAK